jgi:hypothetical protein
VIEGAEYPFSTLPPVARGYLDREHYTLLRDDTIVDPNACFVLDRVNKGDSYVGIARVGVTRVELHGGRVSIDLFHSPNAGYYVVLRPAAGELRGHGTSWGFGVERGRAAQDSVRARRIGPADRTRCIRAAEAEAAAQAARRSTRP